jgi:hypothetical protein
MTTTKKATAEQPAASGDPVARIIERATSNPTAIQMQFMNWAVEQWEAHGQTFKSEREREAFRVAVVYGSRSYPTFQAQKNGRADADLAALVAATGADRPEATPKAPRQAPAKSATRKAAPAKASATAPEHVSLPTGNGEPTPAKSTTAKRHSTRRAS